MLDILELSFPDYVDYDTITADRVDVAVELASSQVYLDPRPDSELALARTFDDLSNCQLLIGVLEDEVSGMLAYWTNPQANSARIEAIATSPRLQRKAGVGTQLLEHLEDRLIGQGIGHVTLSAVEGSEWFHEKNGFTGTGVDRTYEKWLD